MAELLPTDLDLASIKARDADSAATWFKVPALGACGRAFIDRRWLLGEIERLERERDEWSGTAAQRLRETQMALHERDCAVEEVARLKRENDRLKCYLLGVPELAAGDVPDDGKCWIKGCQQPKGHAGYCDPLPPPTRRDGA